MKHPNSDTQQHQEAFLKNCPDDQREFHARMFRVGDAALHYHRQAP
ncbi:MAG: hypothetical protein AAF632_20675 [Bacteroidota bacterium]